jgi:hypothetical protein
MYLPKLLKNGMYILIVSLFDKHKNRRSCIEYMENATYWVEILQIVANGHHKPEI